MNDTPTLMRFGMKTFRVSGGKNGLFEPFCGRITHVLWAVLIKPAMKLKSLQVLFLHSRDMAWLRVLDLPTNYLTLFWPVSPLLGPILWFYRFGTFFRKETRSMSVQNVACGERLRFGWPSPRHKSSRSEFGGFSFEAE